MSLKLTMDRTKNPEMNRWLNMDASRLTELVDKSCRLCMQQLANVPGIPMTTTIANIRLIEIANQLLGVQIRETERGIPAVCLSCAGKLAAFMEFKETVHDNEREFDMIFTVINLKVKINRDIEDDEDMEVIYQCRTCKKSFPNNTEYAEHKKTHNASTSTPSKDSSAASRSQLPVLNVTNLSAIPIPVENGHHAEVKTEKPFDCRNCSKTFNTFAEREAHESEHKRNKGRRTLPPILVLKKPKSRGVRKTQNHQVVNPVKEAVKAKKEMKCEPCDMTFANFKAKWWHDLKHHKVLLGVSGDSKKIKKSATQTCRYCGETFERYISKYHHEKRCTSAPQQEANDTTNGSGNDADNSKMDKTTDDDTVERTKCSKCTEEFTSRRSKTIHEKHVHQMDIRECRMCHRIFGSYPGRYIHEKRCAGEPAEV